jgi:hypothetical protein
MSKQAGKYGEFIPDDLSQVDPARIIASLAVGALRTFADAGSAGKITPVKSIVDEHTGVFGVILEYNGRRISVTAKDEGEAEES